MAAFSLENSNKVWQRVKVKLANANEMTIAQFKALKMYLATQKGNPDLQLLSYTAAGIVGASGELQATGTATVYAIWGVKPATATDVYLVAFDDATNDAGAGTDGRVVLPFLIASPASKDGVPEEAIFISPKGLPLADGLVMKAYTDFDGTTDSSAADAPSGFVIVGA